MDVDADESKPPSVRDPMQAAKMALEAARSKAAMAKELAEAKAQAAANAEKAAAYERYEREQRDKWARQLESALAAFKAEQLAVARRNRMAAVSSRPKRLR